MTKEEAIHEIEKVFEPAFANYIITALAEGATSSDEEQQFCEDAISREAVRKLIWQDNDKYGYSDRFHEFTQKCLQLPSVTPTSDAFDKIINKIEQTRDKDKIAEYPYNRCIRIIEGYIGESEVEE